MVRDPDRRDAAWTPQVVLTGVLVLFSLAAWLLLAIQARAGHAAARNGVVVAFVLGLPLGLLARSVQTLRRLPTLALKPRMPVLFDDDCGPCTRFARFLERADRYGRMETVGFSEARRRALARDVPEERFWTSFHACTPRGTASAADAVWEVAVRLPLLYWPSQWLRGSPFIRATIDRTYAWFVEHRFLLGGPACRLASHPLR